MGCRTDSIVQASALGKSEEEDPRKGQVKWPPSNVEKEWEQLDADLKGILESVPAGNAGKNHNCLAAPGRRHKGHVDCRDTVDTTKEPGIQACVQVEKAECPIMFVAGEDDLIVKAVFFANQVIARMKAHGKTNYTLLRYPGTGHLIEPPYTPHCGLFYLGVFRWYMLAGGEPKGHAAAQKDSWHKILHFFRTHMHFGWEGKKRWDTGRRGKASAFQYRTVDTQVPVRTQNLQRRKGGGSRRQPGPGAWRFYVVEIPLILNNTAAVVLVDTRKDVLPESPYPCDGYNCRRGNRSHVAAWCPVYRGWSGLSLGLQELFIARLN
ncbi:myristoyl-CoA hydrolase [Branchiostoma belcheri]|nr:myristoyl-CoA hydrolase [Branchiostoma belcheri]